MAVAPFPPLRDGSVQCWVAGVTQACARFLVRPRSAWHNVAGSVPCAPGTQAPLYARACTLAVFGVSSSDLRATLATKQSEGSVMEPMIAGMASLLLGQDMMVDAHWRNMACSLFMYEILLVAMDMLQLGVHSGGWRMHECGKGVVGWAWAWAARGNRGRGQEEKGGMQNGGFEVWDAGKGLLEGWGARQAQEGEWRV